MRIEEGNIFEVTRLVLPEHRAVMGFMSKQKSKRARPILTEDQLDEMQYTVSEALDRGRRVRISLYHPYDDIALEGILSVSGTTILIHTADGIIQATIGNIIRVDLL